MRLGPGSARKRLNLSNLALFALASGGVDRDNLKTGESSASSLGVLAAQFSGVLRLFGSPFYRQTENSWTKEEILFCPWLL